MLRLQKHLIISFRTPWLLPATRSLTATAASAAASSPDPTTPFAADDYLVASCGLTPAQALKASKYISHLKSPSKPDAVLAFLSGLGFSAADTAAVVAYDTRILCCKVDQTLAPRIADLVGLEFSPSQIARLCALDPRCLTRRSVLAKIQYYVVILGSIDRLIQAVKRSPYLLSDNLDRVVKRNVAAMRECGLSTEDIAKVCCAYPRLLNTDTERVLEAVACAEYVVGVPRGSAMFRQALMGVTFIRKDKIAAKMEFLKKTFRWSDAEVAIAVSRLPMLLRNSTELLRRSSEFLISEVGLDPEYIANRPALIRYSLVDRLMPRHYVLKFLKAKGIEKRCFYTAVKESEKVFVEMFILPHEQAVPGLTEDYAATRRGKVPSRFRILEP